MMKSVNPKAPSSRAKVDTKHKYLSFVLAGEAYCVPILKVQEIIGCLPITPIPKAPSYVLGLINLRGRVLPVIDLKARFGLATEAQHERSCVIILNIHSREQTVTVGVLVDEVTDVTVIPPADMVACPDFETAIDTTFIQGIGKRDNEVMIVLNVDRILSASEVNIVGTMG